MSMCRFYIVDTVANLVFWTNDTELATQAANSPDNFVIDSLEHCVLTPDGDTDPIEDYDDFDIEINI